MDGQKEGREEKGGRGKAPEGIGKYRIQIRGGKITLWSSIVIGKIEERNDMDTKRGKFAVVMIGNVVVEAGNK